MSVKIPVKEVYRYLDTMLSEKWGYIWGTAGIKCTQAVIDKAANNPSNPNPEITEKYGKQWLDHMVTDCSGVMVYIWKQYGLKIPHGSSSMVRQGYIVDCGPTPNPGWAALVDKTTDTPDNDHIGIVGEDGVTVYEAKGTRYGFVTSKVTDSKWTKFGRFKDVDYGEEDIPVPPVSDTYFATITGDGVRVRSGPGTNYQKVGAENLNKGTEVEVLADCGNWKFCRVTSDNRQGYVFSKYVSEPITKELPAEDTDGDVLANEYIMVKREYFIALYNACKQVVDNLKYIAEVYNG